jgi:hypothetical protein
VIWDPVESRALRTDYKSKKEVAVALSAPIADTASCPTPSKETLFVADFANAVRTGVPCKANLSHIASVLQVIEKAYAAK